MGSINNVLSAKNWKYAIREIVLIVLGILIALGINNWNENRKEYNEETQTLRELKSALEYDLTDIIVNTAFQERSLESTQVILEHIREDKPYHDSLDAHFGKLLGATFFLSDDLVYQSLEVSGRDLISSDSIRKAASILYAHDYSYIKQLEGIDHDMISNFFHPYYSEHFIDNLMFVSATPRDYSRVMNDPRFEGNLEWWVSGKKILVPRYRRVQSKVENLNTMLDRELALR